ncbi:hypothetical protein [uncultured Desulfobulbus sp.]|uniref:hypothetical protein n=1 Tax=uncultured Desulfobulbus sp. TaxID=239745 RepID=UPI0029C936C5|nr:hypothetical protein [uncultured Desulfobulbus sp.]
MGISNIKTIFVSLLAISMVACASGSAIVTGTKRTPLEPSQVKLYLESPAKFEVIGIVNASSDAGWTEQGSVDYAVQELKNQAAKLGANGVLLGATGESTSTVVGGYGTGYMYAIPVTAKTVSGKAIYVSE